ncbi:hypothetical protein Ais01nite_10270 [Asanoa ishikariensis]|uniref:DUF4331 domain-containing protein n=1 Tax=Asanoa ishikariensis TaxID=137265 RepID=A0A1H3T4X6_9ACTN|nr:DUF4331 family protein [Asanoa ishikariensis]GIF62992.1 hypothetical protein Ais01nite_10270 [Asanoa ishikariensis]SDZ45316.1 protein of unknown function [Asanoa ishikariensis]
MSHHLDSDLARQDSRLDLTDQYVFRGTSGTVLVMNVNSTILGDDYREGFHPEARYEFKVHLDGHAVEDLTYRVTFGPVENGRQAVTLWTLTDKDAEDDAAIGQQVAQGRTGETISGPDGLKMWAGKVREPFYNDLTLLPALAAAVQNGTRPDLGKWRPDQAKNAFETVNVNSIVLEIPDGGPLRPGRDIAVWTVTKLATDAGGWQQVNRQATPMLWPLIRTAHRDWAIAANRAHPQNDVRDDGARLAGIIAAVVEASGTAQDPAAYGKTLVKRLLPDLMPYSVGTKASFALAGVNGRNLADNAVEVMFSLVFNAAIPLGLRPEQTAATRSADFPYVVPISS